MGWQTIARKDIRGVVRTRRRKFGFALVAFTFVLGGYLLPLSVQQPSTSDLPGYMLEAVTLLVPLLGLLLGYKTIVAERASGQIALLLSLPHSRRGAVFGKFAGRLLVLAGVVGVGIVLASALVAYPFGSLEIGVLLAYLFVTLAFGTAFLSIGMAISTLTRSSRRATGGTFGVFFLFVILWQDLRAGLFFLLEYLGLASDGLPNWALFVHGLEPGMLYRRIVDGFFSGVESGPYLGPDAPLYLGEWVALVALLLWVVGPISFGYLRFERVDI